MPFYKAYFRDSILTEALLLVNLRVPIKLLIVVDLLIEIIFFLSFNELKIAKSSINSTIFDFPDSCFTFQNNRKFRYYAEGYSVCQLFLEGVIVKDNLLR